MWCTDVTAQVSNADQYRICDTTSLTSSPANPSVQYKTGNLSKLRSKCLSPSRIDSIQALILTALERERDLVLVTVLVRRSVMTEVTTTVVVGSGVPLVVLRLDSLLKRLETLTSELVESTGVLLLSSLLLNASDALLLGASSVVLLLLLNGSTALLMTVGSGALLLDAGSAVLL